MRAIVWQNEALGAKFDYAPIPDDLKESATKYRNELIEAAVELDDEAMEAYLGGEEPSIDTIKKCIRKAVLTGAFYPILCGSAFKNKGVQPLLDALDGVRHALVEFAHAGIEREQQRFGAAGELFGAMVARFQRVANRRALWLSYASVPR